MKSVIIFIVIIIGVSYFFHLMNVRDEANANYWATRQAQCRSLGYDWDLNQNGRCVSFNQN